MTDRSTTITSLFTKTLAENNDSANVRVRKVTPETLPNEEIYVVTLHWPEEERLEEFHIFAVPDQEITLPPYDSWFAENPPPPPTSSTI